MKRSTDKLHNKLPFAEGKRMKPLLKWTGGKSRELEIISAHLPKFVQNGSDYTYIEPFVGGGALFFYLDHPNSIINDYDQNLMDFYKVYRDSPRELEKILLDHDFSDLSKRYYEARALINSSSGDAAARAAAFYVMNQLAFAGMRRFNSKGGFNVPFGHYQRLKVDILSEEHMELLSETKIHCGDFTKVLLDEKDTFIFLDPPYTTTFKTYTAGNCFSEADQIRLAEAVRSLSMSSVMLVINDSDLIRNLYEDFTFHSYDHKYGVNIKNRFDQNSKHVLITNYKV